MENAWKGPGIKDGVDLERGLLGKSTVGQGEHLEYMSFKDAVTFAREHQPDIFKRSQAIKNLRNRVALYCDDKDEPVKFFTAVGTPLDIYHGVDAFFEQDGRIATVDVSMREKETYKADVLLVASLDTEGEIVISESEMKSVAGKVAQILDAGRHKKAA